MRRYTNHIVLLWGAGGGALSNTFFVSLFSYFTVIFTFADYSPYNILIKFLEFNYLNYWILLSISLLHLIIFLKYKDYINEEINYYDDINLNKIIYHIIFVTVLYIIGIITKFNILIFWAINHIIIESLLLLYLYINYIYALYILKTFNIPSKVVTFYYNKYDKKDINPEDVIGHEDCFYYRNGIIAYKKPINNSYNIFFNFSKEKNTVITLNSYKSLKQIYSTNDLLNKVLKSNLDISSLSILEYILNNKGKVSIIGFIISSISIIISK